MEAQGNLLANQLGTAVSHELLGSYGNQCGNHVT